MEESMARIRVGILGCGGIAAIMAETVRKTKGFTLYAAASRNLDKATGFARRNGAKKAYGSYEELLNDPKVDLVYVATPHSEHYANARACIEHRKPCLVEKAFTVNEAQARELFDLAREKDVFITEAIWTRYMPFVQMMRDKLAEGVIGTPVQISANLCYNVKGKARMVEPELAGGSLLDLGVYPLNFAAMLFGTDLLRVEASCTYTRKHLDEQDNITLIYRDGRMATLTASMLGISDRRGMIVGTEGCLVVDNVNNFERMTVYNKEHQKTAVYRRPRQITGYEYELRACRQALENGWTECPEMPHEETLRMMQICDEIRRKMGVVYPCEQDVQPEEIPAAGATPQQTKEDGTESAKSVVSSEERSAATLQTVESPAANLQTATLQTAESPSADLSAAESPADESVTANLQDPDTEEIMQQPEE